jgi:bifunctional UDP-N-acetylglucosamine pyrophosphorylase/glucosamine-1-phosphate N-acetyltransferase
MKNASLRGCLPVALWNWQGFRGSDPSMTTHSSDQPISACAPAHPVAVVILAAGKGTRMKSELHKVLHPIAGRPMLLHLVASAAALHPAKTVVVTGAGREQVEAAVAPLGIATALQAEQLGTGHAVAQARAALAGFEGDVLILYGDVPLVTAATMGRMIERLHGDDAPAAVVLGFRPADPGAYGRSKAKHDRSRCRGPDRSNGRI